VDYCPIGGIYCEYLISTFGVKRCEVCGCIIVFMQQVGKGCPLYETG